MTDKQSIHSLNTFVQPCFASFSPLFGFVSLPVHAAFTNLLTLVLV